MLYNEHILNVSNSFLQLGFLMLEITHNNSELSQLRLKFIIGHFVDRSLTPMFISLSNQLK